MPLLPFDAVTEPAPFRRRVLLNTAATGVGNAWAMVVALVSVPLLLHGLGRDAFGVWVLIQTFSAVTGWFSLADLGFGVALTRTVAARLAVDDHAGAGLALGSGLAVFAAVATIGAVTFAAFGPLVLTAVFKVPRPLRADLRVAAAIYGAQIGAELLLEGIEACAEGLQRVDVSRLVDGIRRTAVIAATSTVALAGGGLVGVAVAGAVAAAAATVVGTVVFARFVSFRTFRIGRSEITALFSYGRMVAILRPLGVIQRTMDRMIVGAVIGVSGVAIVEVATQVLNGTDAVLSATSYAVTPGASWLRSRRDEGSLRQLLVRGTRYSVLATWLVAAMSAGLSVPFVHLWVGHRYAAAPALIAVALCGEMLAAPGQVASNLLLGTGRASAVLRGAAAALVVNLIASAVLVSTIGTVGTFIGTAVANLVLVPALLWPTLIDVGEGPSSFFREAVAPAVLPAVALGAGAFAGTLIPVPDYLRLVGGVVLGTAIALPILARFTFRPDELRTLLAPLRRRIL